MELRRIATLQQGRINRRNDPIQGCSLSSSIVLVCAVLASLAAGVLVAYGICQAMFALFHSHARKVAQTSSCPAIIATPATEG
jgi:hypothetical protein